MSNRDHRRQVVLELAELWRGDLTSLEHVADSANRVYSLVAAGEKLYLRLTSSHDRTRQQIEAELDFIAYLHRGGVSVSLPRTSASGRIAETKQMGDAAYYACAFTEAAGEPFTFSSHESNMKHFRLCGRTLGRIHALAKTYAPSGNKRRFGWDEDDLWRNAHRYLPPAEKVIWREYHRLMEWLRELPKDENSFGLIHGDFGSTNHRCQDDRLTVFDFDDCCYHWFAYDLAVVIYPHGWRPEAKAVVEALLEGYAEEITGALTSIAELEMFCRLRLLYMFLNYAKRWGFAGLTDQQARWFEQKRENIARGYRLSD